MNKSKLAILLLAVLGAWLPGRAQKQVLSVGSTTSLTIKTGTIFSVDSLVLVPGVDFTLSSNNIQVSPTAVNLAAGPSINRVYYLSSPVSFTGTVQFYYQPSELNGNTESTLQYTDSTAVWLPEITSTVNTVSHFVQFAASSKSFIGATASGPATPLPLLLISFSGNWDHEYPTLQWTVFQDGEVINFAIESSSDGKSWITTGEVAGLIGNGTNSYNFVDNRPATHNMFYRIRLIEPTGQYIYSHLIRLQKTDGNNDVRLIATGSGVSVRFSGMMPSSIRLVNVSGMILRADNTSKQEYDLSGLTPGAYFLQYNMNGHWMVREFVVR